MPTILSLSIPRRPEFEVIHSHLFLSSIVDQIFAYFSGKNVIDFGTLWTTNFDIKVIVPDSIESLINEGYETIQLKYFVNVPFPSEQLCLFRFNINDDTEEYVLTKIVIYLKALFLLIK